MGYTKEYIISFFEFWFGLIGFFIIVLWANKYCLLWIYTYGGGSCRHLRGLGDNVG
jgi:hypothetical protein